MKRKASFWVLVILIIAAAALVYVYFGVSANTPLTFVLVIATTLYAAILFWDHWTDVPQLEIQTKDLKISKKINFYSIKVNVLNNGRRDAIDWRRRIQIFNQECGNKVYDSEINSIRSLNNEKIIPDGTASFEEKLPSFKGSFVAEIVVSTHNSKDVKIIEIDNTSKDITYKYGTWKTRSFGFKKHFIGDYGNNWDVDLFENGLKEFEDSSAIRQVIKMLGQTGDANAFEPLVYCLKNDPVEVIRREAVYALGELKNERAVEPLFEYLREYNCAGALGSIFEETDGEKYVEDFIRILKEGDRSGDFVGRIVVVLGMIGKNTDEETVRIIQEALIKLLKEVEKDILQQGRSNKLSERKRDICNVLGDIGFTEKARNVVDNIKDDSRIGNKKELVEKIERRIQKRKVVE